MKNKLSDQLIKAQGRSEFVLVVVADIRDFSKFSTVNESPNIAMFIKRFYLQMLNKYFDRATFVKPTGDGLLMVFPYTEETLAELSAYVTKAMMSCIADFPTICGGDPMINFEVPNSIGFGVARGTACCLFSGDDVIDYSGHLLNLAARLMDLARPGGIVIAGHFTKELIPVEYQDKFQVAQVYIRSIAEERPAQIFYLNTMVQIPEPNLTPLKGDIWQTATRSFQFSEIKKLNNRFSIELAKYPKSADKIKVTLGYPRKDIKDINVIVNYPHFEYDPNGVSPEIVINLEKARNRLSDEKYSGKTAATFTIHYVPKL